MSLGGPVTSRCCVFLRGINVRGTPIKMDDLRQTLADAGYLDVRTVLATGNVLLTVPELAAYPDLKSNVETAIGCRFHYPGIVFIRTAEEIEHIAALSRALTVPTDCHLYVLIGDDPELSSDLTSLFTSTDALPGEALEIKDGTVFWTVPQGFTLKSEFGQRVLGDKRWQSRLTSRNVNTIVKIAALLH